MSKTQKIAYAGFLIAATVVLARFLSFRSDLVRISFEFFPIAVAAVLMGPVWGGVVGAAADVIGAILFPHGPFFPGFTVSAFLTGIIYGLMLKMSPITWRRALLTALVKTTVIDLVLVTLWLMILFQLPLQELFAARMIRFFFSLPLEAVILSLSLNPLLGLLRSRFRKDRLSAP